MLATLLSIVTLSFFVAIAMVACALVGSLLFDLMPVLDNGDERTRRALEFPAPPRQPAVRGAANVVALTPATAVRPATKWRAAA